MNKPFKTLDEQVQLLRDRGLIINDEEQAKNLLLECNYYYLINGFGQFFNSHDNNGNKLDVYPYKTTIEEIKCVEDFHVNFGHVLLKYILAVESKFKAIISYKFSDLTYGAIEAYRDRCFYDINPLQRQYVNKALNKIENTYEHFARENGNSINHYINNHGHVPIWVISEYLTFGVIINFYRGLDPIIREQIAIQLSIFVRKNLGIDINDLKAISLSPKQITLTMTNIKDIRNLLAHRSLLFNAKLQYMYPKYNFVNFNKSNDNNSRKTVFDTIMVLRLFLSINEYNSMIKEISEVTNELKESITSIDCYKILVTLGFPKEFN